MCTRSVCSVIGVVVCLGFCASLSASPTMVDLSTEDSWGEANGARFEQYSGPHGAGTGHINAFLVLQNKGIEEAYNTDGSPLPLDAKEPAHTNALLLSDVPIVRRGDTEYREFLLDIHEDNAGDDRYLSLDQLLIALNSEPDLIGDVEDVFADPVYDLHAGGDSWIKLNSDLSSGGGQADMLLLVPNSYFEGQCEYVYLYSRFGENYAASATPEEWAVRSTGDDTQIPAPGAVILAGLGACVVGALRLGRRHGS